MTATVLVVEDTPANMKLALVILQNAGLKTIEATTGLEAIAMARQHLPDLILMDIQLPGMDGFTAGQALRADPVTASIPIIALTALAMRDEEEKIRAGGFTDYISKPFRYQDFLDRINKVLPGSGGTP